MIRRNEIFEIGQRVGMPRSGCLNNVFNLTGILTATPDLSDDNSDSFMAHIIADNKIEMTWYFLKTVPFELYDGETSNAITTK